MLMTFDHIDKFKEYLSSKHLNISRENEKDLCLPFLDVNFFVKTESLQLTSTENRHPIEFLLASKVLYLKHTKLV